MVWLRQQPRAQQGQASAEEQSEGHAGIVRPHHGALTTCGLAKNY